MLNLPDVEKIQMVRSFWGHSIHILKIIAMTLHMKGW